MKAPSSTSPLAPWPDRASASDGAGNDEVDSVDDHLPWRATTGGLPGGGGSSSSNHDPAPGDGTGYDCDHFNFLSDDRAAVDLPRGPTAALEVPEPEEDDGPPMPDGEHRLGAHRHDDGPEPKGLSKKTTGKVDLLEDEGGPSTPGMRRGDGPAKSKPRPDVRGPGGPPPFAVDDASRRAASAVTKPTALVAAGDTSVETDGGTFLRAANGGRRVTPPPAPEGARATSEGEEGGTAGVPPPAAAAADAASSPSSAEAPPPFYEVEATMVPELEVYPAEHLPDPPLHKKYARGIIAAIIAFFVSVIVIVVSVMQTRAAGPPPAPPPPYLEGSCAKYAGALFGEDCDACSPPLDMDGDVAVTAVSKERVDFFSHEDGGRFEKAEAFEIGYEVGGSDGGVSISGNVAVVGAPDEDNATGAVYVYEKGTSGVWNRTERLLPSDVDEAFQFGRTVRIDGDLIVVGAYDFQGSVYVYRRTDGRWAEEAKLAPDGPMNKDVGKSADVRGDRIAVSDRLYGHDPEGAVYLYEYDEASESWGLTPGGKIQNEECSGRFGVAVALANERDLFVGCPKYKKWMGSVYLYTQLEEGGGYVVQQKLVASAGGNGNRFGGPQQIAADGDVLTVGEYRNEGGIVYVYVRKEGDNWTEAATIDAPPGSQSPYFGDQLSLSENRVIIASSGNVHSYDLTECLKV